MIFIFVYFVKSLTFFFFFGLFLPPAGIFTAGTVSGAHLNPAVSLVLAIMGRFKWKRVLRKLWEEKKEKKKKEERARVCTIGIVCVCVCVCVYLYYGRFCVSPEWSFCSCASFSAQIISLKYQSTHIHTHNPLPFHHRSFLHSPPCTLFFFFFFTLPQHTCSRRRPHRSSPRASPTACITTRSTTSMAALVRWASLDNSIFQLFFFPKKNVLFDFPMVYALCFKIMQTLSLFVVFFSLCAGDWSVGNGGYFRHFPSGLHEQVHFIFRRGECLGQEEFGMKWG